MSQFSETKLPCEDCGSSDARAVYHSGVSICFSCGVRHAPGAVSDIPGKRPFVIGSPKELGKRKLTMETCRRYGYVVGEQDGVTYQVAPYYDAKSGFLVAQKLRDKDKSFSIAGDASKMGLWGLQLAKRNGKMIVITEGEIDAMSVSQALGNTWPAVSLPNGAGNLKAIQDNLEFLETYEKVVICFDNDEPGLKATQAVLELLSPGKAYVAKLGDYKDANEALLGDPKLLRNAIWEAQQYRPDGVIALEDIRERIEKPLEPGWSYPWGGLNALTYGFRPGELVTWCAGTGVGKTAIVSELVYHCVTELGLKVGLIFLEESVERTARRLLGIAMDKPIHLPSTKYSEEEFDAAWEKTVGTGRVAAWDHFGSCDVDVLGNRVRYFRKSLGCDVVVLDHISMVVSGSDLDADERRLLDNAMTNLRSLTQETGLNLQVVSHLKRTQGSRAHEEGGQVSLAHLRGTQAIAQLSDAVIALERNQQAETDDLRNTTGVRVLKNRYTGLTGPCERLMYERDTGRLRALGPEGPEAWGETEEDY